MRGTAPGLLRRLAGAAAASGLALVGPVLVAAPASAAACSGTAGVTVVVDTGSSISTKCASGDPSSAMKALAGAGFSVTHPQQFPGSVVCRINGVPKSDPCVRMPPGDAYWAFFHARRGGGWTYSSNGVASHDPAPGAVVGFRFGSGQQPRVAPPAPVAKSKPVPTAPRPRATPAPTKRTTAPASTPRRTTAGSTPGSRPGSTPAPRSTGSTAGTDRAAASTRPTAGTTPPPGATPSPGVTPSPGATASPDATASGRAAPSSPADDGPTPVAAERTSGPAEGSGTGTLLAGGALVALVAAGAGFAAWKRRG